MRLAVLVALLGCGRVGFDPFATSGDGPAPDSAVCLHDEDGDGIGDCEDNCPHIAGVQDDTDGDGVGDLCDPGAAMQRLLLFDPLLGSHPFDSLSTGWTQQADSLHHDGSGSSLFIVKPMRDIDVWIGARIDSIVGPARAISLSLTVDDGVTPFSYGEVYQDQTEGPYVAVSRFDGTNYSAVNLTTIGAFPTGEVVLRIGVRDEPDQLVTQLDPLDANAIGPATGYTGTPGLSLFVNGVTLELHYIAIIETP